MDRRVLLFACVVCLALASPSEARKWTDAAGNQLSAEYVRIHEGEVILRQGSRLIKCPYDKFSDLDKAYIREQMEAERTKSKRRAGLNQIGGPVEPEVTDGDARELRTWSDLQGKKILAQYTGFSGASVELIKDGLRVSYPYIAFSPSDQAYVAQILMSEGRADEIPRLKQEGEEEGSRGGPPRRGSGYGGPSSMESGYSPPEPDYEVSTSSGGPNYGNGGPSYGSGYEPESHRPGSSAGTFPHVESPAPPSFPSPMMQPQMVMQKKCMKCNGIVPDSTKVGDRCPHCHVTFGYEVGADGKRTSSGESWRYRRAVIRLGILGFFVVMAALGALSRR